jgi:hypothetical protein
LPLFCYSADIMLLSRIVGALLVVCAFAGVGCSTNSTIRQPTSPAEAAQILAGPGSRAVRLEIEFPEGPEVLRGALSPFDADTFTIVEPSGQKRSVPFQDVRSITYNDRFKGLRNGFLVGAISGFLAGALLSRDWCSDRGDMRSTDDSWSSSCNGNNLIQAGLASGLVAGVIGGVAGVVIGHPTILTF